MPHSVFTSQVPAVPDATDSKKYTLGTLVFANTTGTITHGRWRFPNTLPTGAVDFVLYDYSSQAVLARATFVSPVAGAWNTVALPAPVAYSTANRYLIAAVVTPNRYLATVGYFNTVATVNGNLTSPATTGNDPNGRLGTGDIYPPGSANGSCYFADIVFVPAGEAVQVSTAVASTWDVAGAATTQVTTQVATVWGVAASAGKSVATSWDVAAPPAGQAAKSVATVWHVGGPVASAAVTSWNVAASASRSVATTWNVSTSAAKTVATSWDTAARATKSVATTWAVDGSPAAGIVVRPNTGLVARPNTGVVVRP